LLETLLSILLIGSLTFSVDAVGLIFFFSSRSDLTVLTKFESAGFNKFELVEVDVVEVVPPIDEVDRAPNLSLVKPLILLISV